MLNSSYDRIYYHHLKKCGGSTLNQWLDTLTSDSRTCRAAWHAYRVPSEDDEAPLVRAAAASLQARMMFHWTDVVYGHAAMVRHVPARTFCFTMLRDPVQRLISQIWDWRRLSAADLVNAPAAVRACAEDCQRMPLREVLERHGPGGGRGFLDNYMTRALASGRIGNLVEDITDAERLLEFARTSMELDYQFVGLTDAYDVSRNAFCGLIGMPPASVIPAVNVTRGGGAPDGEIRAARDILKELTRVDRMLYESARVLFDQKFRPLGEQYDMAAFEAGPAGRVLAGLKGVHCDGAVRYSVREPIIGSGFHGRDGSGSADCAVWTGPARRAVLYIPVLARVPVSLLMWVRGYVDPRQRGQLRVWVDGHPAAHRFDACEGYADLLVVDTVSQRDFVRLELEVDEMLESGEPGSQLHDARERAIAFDGYGWRLI